jgi:hypothetical protein
MTSKTRTKKHTPKVFTINPLFLLTKHKKVTAVIRAKEVARFFNCNQNLKEGITDDSSWDGLAGHLHMTRCLSDITGEFVVEVTELYNDVAPQMSEVFHRARDTKHPLYIGKFVYPSTIISKVDKLFSYFCLLIKEVTQGQLHEAYTKMHEEFAKNNGTNKRSME